MCRVFLRLLLACAFTFAPFALAAQVPPTLTELDPGIAVGIELNRRIRLDFLTGREKSDEIESAKNKVSAGISFRAKSKFPSFLDAIDSDKQHVLVFGAVYEYSKATEAGAKSIEHKIMADVTGRYAFAGKLLISDRNRFEFRWINGDYRSRFRNRLMIEREFKVRKYKLTPYGAAEAFRDFDFKKWNQFRFTAGVVLPLFRRTSLDIYYERSHCTTCANPHTNVFGASISIFLRLKKK